MCALENHRGDDISHVLYSLEDPLLCVPTAAVCGPHDAPVSTVLWHQRSEWQVNLKNNNHKLFLHICNSGNLYPFLHEDLLLLYDYLRTGWCW